MKHVSDYSMQDLFFARLLEELDRGCGVGLENYVRNMVEAYNKANWRPPGDDCPSWYVIERIYTDSVRRIISEALGEGVKFSRKDLQEFYRKIWILNGGTILKTHPFDDSVLQKWGKYL